MTDIMTKLEWLANLKPYDGWPADGEISAICAEALAEIQRLRLDLAHNNALRFVWPVPDGAYTHDVPLYSNGRMEDLAKSLKNLPDVRAGHQVADLPPMICTERKTEPVAPLSGRFVFGVDGLFTPQPQTPSAPEPAPEPWGSSFAMNTENWK